MLNENATMTFVDLVLTKLKRKLRAKGIADKLNAYIGQSVVV